MHGRACRGNGAAASAAAGGNIAAKGGPPGGDPRPARVRTAPLPVQDARPQHIKLREALTAGPKGAGLKVCTSYLKYLCLCPLRCTCRSAAAHMASKSVGFGTMGFWTSWI